MKHSPDVTRRSRAWFALLIGAVVSVAAVCGGPTCIAAEPDSASDKAAGATAEQAADQAPDKARKAPSSSLDDALLNDLDNELLEGAGDSKKRSPGGKPAGSQPGDKPVDGQTESEVIDDTMPAEDADPLVHISEEMRSAEELIPQSARHAHAEQLQDRIVEDLARLIEQAENQRSQQSKSSSKSGKSQSTAKREGVNQPKQAQGKPGKTSDQPAQDSTNRLGRADAARPDPELFKTMMKDAWGHLPARDREQVLQSTPDKFLPQYELMIEKYYQRLAEDQESK